MLGINGKQWNDIQWTDVEEFLNEIEESFFFEFKKDEVSGAKLIKEIACLLYTSRKHQPQRHRVLLQRPAIFQKRVILRMQLYG